MQVLSVSRERHDPPRLAYVTNLALPLTTAVGGEPEEDVTLYTVSRIRLRNPSDE
ncbi:MAG: hypothetical protein ACR2HE_13595 [Casimicrobiaceae bacterium]